MAAAIEIYRRTWKQAEQVLQETHEDLSHDVWAYHVMHCIYYECYVTPVPYCNHTRARCTPSAHAVKTDRHQGSQRSHLCRPGEQRIS